MRLVLAGTPEVAVPSLDALAASDHEVVGVVTRPDAPAGRGRRLVASPVALRAEELGIPVLKPEHPRDPEFQDRLRALEPDCCPVVAYGALLPQSALDAYRHDEVAVLRHRSFGTRTFGIVHREGAAEVPATRALLGALSER